MDSKTIDLGSCVARMTNSKAKYSSLNLLEFLTPPDYDENGHFVRDSQFICVQGNDTIEQLRDALNELWPNKVEEMLSNEVRGKLSRLTEEYVNLKHEDENQREDYHKMHQELIKVNNENTYLKGMMKDMELKENAGESYIRPKKE